jgi:hypothetical protein
MCSCAFTTSNLSIDSKPTDINNVGSMSLALSAKGDPSYDKSKAARWQATQVSTLSIMNFSGRIFIGELSPSFLETICTLFHRPYIGLYEELSRFPTFLLPLSGRFSVYCFASPYGEYR